MCSHNSSECLGSGLFSILDEKRPSAALNLARRVPITSAAVVLAAFALTSLGQLHVKPYD